MGAAGAAGAGVVAAAAGVVAAAGAGVAAVATVDAAGATGATAVAGAMPGEVGMLARVCKVRSSDNGVEDAAASFCAGSNPNMSTVYLQEVEGKPPISNRPASSVTVVILSVPHSAVTVAPGMVCPPERTTPVCTSAAATPANISNARHEDRNIEKIPFDWNTR